VTHNSKFLTAYYIANIFLLVMGIYLWITVSGYRLIILYSLFNIVLLRVTRPVGKAPKYLTSTAYSGMFRWVSLLLAILFALLMVAVHQSLYTRPSFVVPLTAFGLTLFIVLVLAPGSDTGNRTFFSKESFFLLAIILAILFVEFSIYLAQTDLTGPVYGCVDAYRDYVNAERIFKLARVEPKTLVLERYYKMFPVLPLEIVTIGLMSNLPLNVVHLIVAMIWESTTALSLIMLSKLILRKRFRPTWFLSLLIVLLQPLLVDPAFLLIPIRVSILVLTLVFYLVYTRRIAHSLRLSGVRAHSIAIVLLTFIVVPLHPASAIFLIAVLAIMALHSEGQEKYRFPFLRLATLFSVYFLVYALFSAETPFLSILGAAREIYAVLKELFALGPSVVSEMSARAIGGLVSDEMNSFLQAVAPALVLSMFTVFLVGSRRTGSDVKDELPFHRLFGLLLMAGYGSGLVLSIWGIDLRYFVFPLVPLALIATTMVLSQLLQGATSMGKLVAFGLLALYSVSIVVSPSFLHESNPAYSRLVPTGSEGVAASFVSTSYDTSVPQIVADFPFYAHVRGLLWSQHIDLEERTVRIPILIYEPMNTSERSLILIRKYFFENTYLRGVTPNVVPLLDVGKFGKINRICDVGSTQVFLGRLNNAGTY